MIYNIYRYYKILRLCIAIVLLLYHFTIYFPLSITRTNQYKYYYYVQKLLYYYYYLLKLLKNYIWIECDGLTFEKVSGNAVRTDQLIK